MTNSQKIESDCRQKLQKLDSEYQQKLIPYNFTGREGLPGLPDPVISGTHTAESQAKGEAIQREYHRKRAAIVASATRGWLTNTTGRKSKIARER